MSKEETCFECPDRQIGCHSKCPEWAKRQAKKEKARENRRKAYKIEDDIRDYQIRAIEKAKRRHR